MGVLGRYLERTFRATEELNRKAILKVVEPRPGGALLDCGCGDGSFTAEIAACAGVARICGIEGVEERASAARGRGIEVASSDLNEGLGFADATFDVVHANQLLEHLSRTDEFLREVRRVLKPAGYAILSTNNLASWHNVASLALGFQPPPMHVSSEAILGNPLDPFHGRPVEAWQDSHLRIFSFRGLKEVCEYHRLRVEVLRTVGFYPFPPALARALAAVDRRHGAFLLVKVRPA